MFTWVCPKCGGNVDVAEDTCPHCAARDGAAAESIPQPSPEPPAVDPQPVPTAPVRPPVPPEPLPVPAPAAGLAAEQAEPVAGQTAKKLRLGLELRPKQWLIFGGALLVAIGIAVGLSTGLGGLFSALRLEDPEETVESPVETFAIGVRGPIEVSGIRPYYDEDFQTHVRAFVANHSKEPRSVAIQVLLRVRQASVQAPPLATFEVVISDPLPPNGGQEVDVALAAMGSLQSLPPWDEIRVDIETLGSPGG